MAGGWEETWPRPWQRTRVEPRGHMLTSSHMVTLLLLVFGQILSWWVGSISKQCILCQTRSRQPKTMDHEMRISLSRCWLQWCRIGLLASTRRGLNDIFPLPELLLLLAQTWHFSRPTHRNICMNLLWQVVELELEGCHATFTLKNNFIYRQRLFQAICHLFIKVYIRTTFLFNRKKN